MSKRQARAFGVLLLAAVAGAGGGLTVYAAPAHVPQKTVKATEVSGKYVFAKSKITVKVGTKVWWTNTSDAPHTVTSKGGGWSYDKQLATAQKLGFVFKKAGTFHYFCKYHSGMVGTIVVQK